MSPEDIDRSKAGVVVSGIIPSPYWSAVDHPYAQGGSPEFPLRTIVEKRIKPVTEIMKLSHPEARIEPTNNCNYNCIMCPREQLTRPLGIMPMPFYISLVNELILMGADQISFSNYGEPFVDPRLEDKILYAAQKGLRTYVITNASLLNLESRSEFAKQKGKKLSKIEAAVAAGLSELRISFYGINKQDYEKIMRRGNFDKVTRNLKLLNNTRERFGTQMKSKAGTQIKNPEVSIYFLEFGDGEGLSKESKKFLEFTKPFADYVEVWRPHNFGDGRQYRDVTGEKQSCMRMFSGPIQINWQGIVVPCCADFNEALPMGNAAMQTIEEILTGPAYEKLRQVHKAGDFEKIPFCDKCDLLQEHEDALVFTTNPAHQGKSNKAIMKTSNARPDVEIK